MMIRKPCYPWLILAVASIHLAWSILLLISDRPLKITAISGSPWSFNQYVASAFYFIITVLALVGVFWRRSNESVWGICFYLPQQLVLVLSAKTAVECVMSFAYADGVPRPWEFIIADQFFVLAICVFHTWQIIDWHFIEAQSGQG